MRTSFRLPAAALTVSFILAACGEQSGQQAAGGGQMPPPQAGYVEVTAQPFTLVNELPGRTTPYQVAEVRPQVTGIIEERLFKEGDRVKAGQPLYQLDDKLYQAALASAEADLANAQANRELAKLTDGRYDKLSKSEAVSQQELEDANANLAVSEAQVAAAQARLDTARINVEYTTIKAPINGRIGRSSLTAGALVTANQAAALVTIRQLDPIYVDLTQSYEELRSLRAAMANGELITTGKDQATVELALPDGTVYPHKGTLQFSEYAVDEQTGTVALRALIPNPDGALLPGMFVRARLPQGEREKAIVVPQKGISRQPNGSATALVIGENNIVEKRTVKTEQAVGGNWLIKSGLNAGDKLIVDGLQKIGPGIPVTPVDVNAEKASAQSSAEG
ncbi:MAG: efflux RND transporter periplasmic adaptor subunit [Thalassolituus maritimus]|nr:MAG: efflux RND transporter periplasmic adaptor subunit [Thalassolituus maritimus]